MDHKLNCNVWQGKGQKNQFLSARNWPFGAAISISLVLITFGLVKIYQKIGGKMDDLGGF